ncbi:MAG: glycosyl transferase [Firmicutes bacterium]|nr:glycosyl transferase [Bacillota bacterium]
MAKLGIIGTLEAMTRKADMKLSDEKYIIKQFKKGVGRAPNLTVPQTMNEKIQWLKLNDKNPLYVKYLDKLAVRDIITEKFGEEYLIPITGVYEDYNDIRLDGFLHPFVLKCTHGNGYYIIMKDTYNQDRAKMREIMTDFMQRDYFYVGREWPYKEIPHRILAERYIDDRSVLELIDYCVMCFNGQVKYVSVYSDKNGIDKKCDVFNDKWEKQDVKWVYEHNPDEPKCPKTFDKMVEIASELAKDIPFMCVDFFDVDGKLYFSEVTLYPNNGFKGFDKPEFDLQLGEMIKL